jgi:hypothetical protein
MHQTTHPLSRQLNSSPKASQAKSLSNQRVAMHTISATRPSDYPRRQPYLYCSDVWTTDVLNFVIAEHR